MIINNKREGEQGRGMPRPYLGTVGNVLSAGQSVQDTEWAGRAGSDPGEEEAAGHSGPQGGFPYLPRTLDERYPPLSLGSSGAQ